MKNQISELYGIPMESQRLQCTPDPEALWGVFRGSLGLMGFRAWGYRAYTVLSCFGVSVCGFAAMYVWPVGSVGVPAGGGGVVMWPRRCQVLHVVPGVKVFLLLGTTAEAVHGLRMWV